MVEDCQPLSYLHGTTLSTLANLEIGNSLPAIVEPMHETIFW
jgi:hypothetical protein